MRLPCLSEGLAPLYQKAHQGILIFAPPIVPCALDLVIRPKTYAVTVCSHLLGLL